jgi:voltage-gated potassium channel
VPTDHHPHWPERYLPHLPRVVPPLPRPLPILLTLLFGGTIGYVLIEGYTPFEGLYMTVITVSTVGYGEVRPLSQTGRAFTIVLIVGGVAAALYTLTELFTMVYAGRLGANLARRRMTRQVDHLRNHVILCGFGRVGHQIAEDLAGGGHAFVVVEREPQGVRDATALGYLVVEGDAGSDGVLRAAGVERARVLITAVASDADNLVVTLSARSLNARLLIVARAAQDESVAKLERAGADRVVSPYQIGGRRMAMLALRPLSVEFVDSVFHQPQGELLLEEIEVGA